MEAETAVRHLQAKECQGLLAIARNEEANMEQILPQSLQKECSPDDTFTLAQGNPFWTSDFQNYKLIDLCFYKPLSLW